MSQRDRGAVHHQHGVVHVSAKGTLHARRHGVCPSVMNWARWARAGGEITDEGGACRAHRVARSPASAPASQHKTRFSLKKNVLSRGLTRNEVLREDLLQALFDGGFSVFQGRCRETP